MEKDLNKLRDRAFKCAKEHGFHDVNYSDKHLLMLVITELSEAVEADRKGKHGSSEEFIKQVPLVGNANPSYYSTMFNTLIKDTVEDELADAVIRLLDFAGVRNIDIDIRRGSINIPYNFFKDKTFTELSFHLCGIIIMDSIGPYIDRVDEDVVNISLYFIFKWCEYMDIDIFNHIELKMMYNEFRPRLHGKKY